MTPSVVTRIVVVTEYCEIEPFKEVHHAVVLEFLRLVAEETNVSLLPVFVSVCTAPDRDIQY